MPEDRPLADAEAPPDVRIHSSQTVYRGYFRLDHYRLSHRRHDGGWTGEMQRELFERGHVAAVLPYDPLRDEVLLLRQFRIGALAGGKAPWQSEIVAGIIEPGETAEDVARRETREESGCQVRELVEMYHYLASPGGSTETVRLYCGLVETADAGGIHGLEHENEDIEVTPVPFDAAWRMVEDGRIDNAPAIIALQWLALNRERLRTRGPAE